MSNRNQGHWNNNQQGRGGRKQMPVKPVLIFQRLLSNFLRFQQLRVIFAFLSNFGTKYKFRAYIKREKKINDLYKSIKKFRKQLFKFRQQTFWIFSSFQHSFGIPVSNFSIFHEHNRDRRGAGGRGFYEGLVTGAKRLPLDPKVWSSLENYVYLILQQLKQLLNASEFSFTRNCP